MIAPQIIARAFIGACRAELDAPKPGNVHVYAAGHGMTATQFEDSAAVAAGPLCASGARVGARVRGAVEATVKAVGTNTNLGIVLLCGPLAAAADPAFGSSAPGGLDLHSSLIGVLDGLDVADAGDAFAAIVRASPAGLGRAERHDVHTLPQVTLKQAMTEALHRDRVARQYATGFADVFGLGIPLHAAAAARWSDPRAVTLAVYLGFLSRFRDSHVMRKHGADTAAEVRRNARKFDALLQQAQGAAGLPCELLDALLAWDAALKVRGVNPGTTADLTVATLFAVRLQSVLPSARISG